MKSIVKVTRGRFHRHSAANESVFDLEHFERGKCSVKLSTAAERAEERIRAAEFGLLDETLLQQSRRSEECHRRIILSRACVRVRVRVCLRVRAEVRVCVRVRAEGRACNRVPRVCSSHDKDLDGKVSGRLLIWGFFLAYSTVPGTVYTGTRVPVQYIL